MKKLRKFSIMLAVVLALCAGTGSAAAFSDTEDHWAAGAIEKWSNEYQVLQGYDDGTFRPDNRITRGAFAGILTRFMRYEMISGTDAFSDIAGTYWEEEILKLHAAGVYLGTDGKALAGNSITRQQAVTMLARAFRISPTTTTLPYSDAGQIAEYAQAYVAEFAAQGYLTDCFDGRFRPGDAITRAEFVNIMNQMIAVLVQERDTVSGNVLGTVMINSDDGAALEDATIYGDLIIAPGVKGEVSLQRTEVLGYVQNFSEMEVTYLPDRISKPDKDKDTPALTPEDVYEAGETTGETLRYNNQDIPVYDVEKNALSPDDFHWDDDRLVYSGKKFKTRFGIDVSAYQNRASANQTIDWDAVANDGVDFAMVRIGLRGTSTGALHADAFYQENIEGAMEAGIRTGVYFFAQAITVEEAIEEAEFVLELLEDYEIDGPVAYDWEMHDSSYRVYGTEPAMATACAVAFCQTIEEAGYDAMVYAGTYVSYIKYDHSALKPYLYWYPEYKGESSEKLCPTVIYQMDYWQFSSNCQVDGIGGRVDGNLQFVPKR